MRDMLMQLVRSRWVRSIASAVMGAVFDDLLRRARGPKQKQ